MHSSSFNDGQGVPSFVKQEHVNTLFIVLNERQGIPDSLGLYRHEYRHKSRHELVLQTVIAEFD